MTESLQTTLRRKILASWPEIVERSGVNPAALRCLPKVPRLLGSSVKTETTREAGYLTAVVYLSPAGEAFEGGTREGCTLCPGASEGCWNTCLGHSSGRMTMTEKARLWKTALYLGARNLFVALAVEEVKAFGRKAQRKHFVPVVRFDGSSDTGVGRIIARQVPWVQFYDYTKVLRRLSLDRPANYHLTFSFNGENAVQCSQALKRGHNVAVVFDTKKGEALPRSLWGCVVIDGDRTDARWTDPKHVVVGLRFKTAHKRETALKKAGSFVMEAK